MPIKTTLSIGLRSIPPANRRPGSLSRTARYGKPARATQQDTASTSFRPRVVLPDPRLQVAREAFCKALQKRVIDLERLITEAVNEEEADYWRGLLKRLT